MRALAALLLAVALISCTKNKAEPTRPVFSTAEDRGKPELQGAEQFRLIDQFSNAHSLSDYTDRKSIFLVAAKKECTGGREKELAASLKAHDSSPVLLVTGNPGEAYEDYQHYAKPVLFDRWQFLLRRYELRKAGDFAEISTLNGQVIRKGTVPLQPGQTDCAIYAGSGGYDPLNFSRDVLPSFASACLDCHMRFSGTDYFTSMPALQKWSKMIAKSMELYRMPPGGVDPYLVPLEKATRAEHMTNIYRWAASGAPYTPEDETNYARAREARAAELNSEDNAGVKPDFVFTMSKPHKIPASGAFFYDSAQIAGPMPNDVWIKAANFSHNLSVLHHSNLLVTTKPIQAATVQREGGWMFVRDHDLKQREAPLKIKTLADGKRVGGLLINENAAFSISRRAGYIPSREGMAAFIPKGSYLILQNHYQPSGKAEENVSKVALFKYDVDHSPPPKRMRRFFVRPKPFKIPAHRKGYEVKAVLPIEQDVSLLSFTAHMHFRGRSSKLFVTPPNQPPRLLVSIPFFQMKFERAWAFQQPVFVEKGSKLTVVTMYDNSAQNISNPDPDHEIKFGESTYFNEMHSMRIMYVEGKM